MQGEEVAGQEAEWDSSGPTGGRVDQQFPTTFLCLSIGAAVMAKDFAGERKERGGGMAL